MAAKKKPTRTPTRGKAGSAPQQRTATSASKRRRWPKPKRVCILTGGGDAPGLNAVVRAFVKACLEYDIEVYGSEDGFEGLIQSGKLVKLKRDSVRGILPKGGSILGCSNRANPFAYPTVDKRGRKRDVDVSAQVLERIQKHEIEALVMVGGDGTMDHAKSMMELGVPVIGVPKTIDNDLAATDFTFGFDTAVGTATWAIDALHSTAESHDRVMVLELMGRYAGWIALHAGIAGGADAIAIPEIPYDVDRIAARIKERADRGTTFSIVVVGEGAKPKGGTVATLAKGRKGHLERLGGAGAQVAALLGERLDHELRVTVLGHLQRGGSPSSFDRLLGTRFGVAAANLVRDGKMGRMVALRGNEITHVPIEKALAAPKLVPNTGELIQTAKAIGIEVGEP